MKMKLYSGFIFPSKTKCTPITYFQLNMFCQNVFEYFCQKCIKLLNRENISVKY